MLKSYFHGVIKILVSIFKYFFTLPKDTNKPRRTAYERLLSASICDTMEFVVKNTHVYCSSSKDLDLSEQPIIQKMEQIVHEAPLIPDIKKQFRTWSANMKEYDAIRKRLLNSMQYEYTSSNSRNKNSPAY